MSPHLSVFRGLAIFLTSGKPLPSSPTLVDYHPPSGPDAGRFPLRLTLDSLPTSSLEQKDILTLERVGEIYIALLELKVS